MKNSVFRKKQDNYSVLNLSTEHLLIEDDPIIKVREVKDGHIEERNVKLSELPASSPSSSLSSRVKDTESLYVSGANHSKDLKRNSWAGFGSRIKQNLKNLLLVSSATLTSPKHNQEYISRTQWKCIMSSPSATSMSSHSNPSVDSRIKILTTPHHVLEQLTDGDTVSREYDVIPEDEDENVDDQNSDQFEWRWPTGHSESSCRETDSCLYDEVPSEDVLIPSKRDFRSRIEVKRDRITIESMIGEGHFGDVFRGYYRKSDDTTIPVAIKTCKSDVPPEDVSYHSSYERMVVKIREEAIRMIQLNHPHIIKLIGICCGDESSATYLIMELAEMGQLRSYLSINRNRLDVATLILYSYQISTALCYLESKRFIHRDIAARNILVSSSICVKLGDFGLTRSVGDEHDYYDCSRGNKLPIKWMAPESVNFRRFTSASDVWMFAVCVWEILSYGLKPFAGIKNVEAVARIEEGQRLPKPDGCPDRLFSLMSSCWSYSPWKRPKFIDVKNTLREIYEEERSQDVAGSLSKRDSDQISDRIHSWGSSASGASEHDFVTASQTGPRGSIISCPASGDFEFRPGVTSRETSVAKDHVLSEVDSLSRRLKEQRLLELKLEKQRRESEADAKWLAAEEANRRLSSGSASSLTSESSRKRSNRSNLPSGNKISDVQESLTPEPAVFVTSTSVKESLFGSNGFSSGTSSSESNHSSHGTQSQKIVSSPDTTCENSLKSCDSTLNPTADLNRTGDHVYSSMTKIVEVVKDLLTGVKEAQTHSYLDLVKNVGLELRGMLTAVDELMPSLPDWSHQEISMAHGVLAKDMGLLINSMKAALKYSKTIVEEEYRKQMLKSSHILVIDAKHLLDTVDSVRLRIVHLHKPSVVPS